MASKRRLTELEGSVLGVIRLKGPCTPYAVRCEFRDSITPHWSASAGAIYPLVARLTRQRLLRVARPLRDGRGGKLYMLTAAGERSFIQWLEPPFSLLHLGPPPDPIRTRMNFLNALPAARQRTFMSEAAKQLTQYLATMTAREVEISDAFERLALEGCLRMMVARVDWMRELAQTLAGGASQV
jgi:DNA-binding PadR family transcriptional regulator